LFFSNGSLKNTGVFYVSLADCFLSVSWYFQRHYDFDLISGHIILYAYEDDSTTQYTLRVWDSNSLMEYILQHQNADKLTPPLFSRIIPVRCTNFRAWVFPSPLEDDTYTIWILLALNQSSVSILKYRLSLGNSQPLQLSFCREGICAIREAMTFTDGDISHAGHFWMGDSHRVQVFSLAEHIWRPSSTNENPTTTKTRWGRKKLRKVRESVT
jgi:hypothetical protein